VLLQLGSLPEEESKSGSLHLTNGFKCFFFRLELTFITAAMVQKYQSPIRVYKHPFELIMAVSINFGLNSLTWQLVVLLSMNWAPIDRCCGTHVAELIHQIWETHVLAVSFFLRVFLYNTSSSLQVSIQLTDCVVLSLQHELL